MISESELLKRIQVRATELGCRLFRNNNVKTWVSSKSYHVPKSAQPHMILVNPGDTVLSNARSITAGLGVGTSDLIGWKTVTITPEMVGSRVAVLMATEVKSGRGRATEEQKSFLELVQRSGGISILAYDIEGFEQAVGPRI